MIKKQKNKDLIRKKKQIKFDWKDFTITMETKLAGKYLLLATQEYIYVNEKLIISAGGYKFKEKGIGEFVDAKGKRHQIEYKCGGFVTTRIPCTILFDGEIVYKGSIPIKGIIKGFLVWISFAIILAIILFCVL